MDIMKLLPLTIICMVFIVFAVFYLLQRGKSSNIDSHIMQRKTAQDFTNVKNIKDMFLYTQDNHLITYIKVQPITIGLLTTSEKNLLTRNLTNEFSQEKEPFKFIAISRPVDIGPLIAEYSELLSNTTDQIQKELLRNEIRVITDFSMSGEVVEREFYYILWTKEGDSAEADLRKRTRDLAGRIDSAGITCSVLQESEIIKLCNLVNNPALAAVETTNTDATIPFIKLYE